MTPEQIKELAGNHMARRYIEDKFNGKTAYIASLDQLQAYTDEAIKLHMESLSKDAVAWMLEDSGVLAFGPSNQQKPALRGVLQGKISDLFKAPPEVEALQAENDDEQTLRISKSGYSIKVGWTEKRIVANAPLKDGMFTEQWMEDAERLCDGWNRQVDLQADNDRLTVDRDEWKESTIDANQRFQSAEDKLRDARADNDRLREALNEVRLVVENRQGDYERVVIKTWEMSVAALADKGEQ